MQIICSLYLLMKLELLKFCHTSGNWFYTKCGANRNPPGISSSKLSSSKKIFAIDMQNNCSYDNQYEPGFSGKKYLDAANRHIIQHV